MAETHASTKGPFESEVVSNRRIGECFWKIKLAFRGTGARALARFEPGQFVQMDVANCPLPPVETIPKELRDAAVRNVLLRRPFSFSEVVVSSDQVVAEILYCVVGAATVRMTALSAGDSVSVIGPLGRGFWMPDGKRLALLVVGGMGAPPIQCMAAHLSIHHQDVELLCFAGAKSAAALPFEVDLAGIGPEPALCIPEFAQYDVRSIVATDDGSAGFKGFVTEALARWLDSKNRRPPDEIVIYGCGPEPMLAGLAKLANERGVDCQLSLERRMACGIGLCQSCAVECKTPNEEEAVYRLCCQDGPVFEAKDVVF